MSESESLWPLLLLLLIALPVLPSELVGDDDNDLLLPTFDNFLAFLLWILILGETEKEILA